MRLALVIGVLALAFVVAAPASEPPQADMQQVRSALEESHADRSVGAVDWGDWMAHFSGRAFQAVAQRLARKIDGMNVSDRLLRIVMSVAIAAVLGVVLVLVAWFLRNRPRRRGPEPSSADQAEGASPEAGRDSAWWRAELERRLDAGDLGNGLEALWWWLAGTIAGSGVDASWTNRELMRRSGRADLAPQLRTLDALSYGSGAPEAAALRSLVAELEGRLA